MTRSATDIIGIAPNDCIASQLQNKLHTETVKAAPQGEGYAGDVSATYAFDILKAEDDAVLVDVRTRAEWSFVGVPDTSDAGKLTHFIEWLSFPEMSRNERFMSELEHALGGGKDMAVFFLCRSGQRSRAAAIAATEQGYMRAYNVEGGFEGGLDAERHRGRVNGWKADGLPWAQT